MKPTLMRHCTTSAVGKGSGKYAHICCDDWLYSTTSSHELEEAGVSHLVRAKQVCLKSRLSD